MNQLSLFATLLHKQFHCSLVRPSVVTCQIARASDVEVVAAHELAEAIGEPVALSEITRLGIIIASMLTGLIR